MNDPWGERVLFYLKNRARIEEWAALKKDAVAQVHDWLMRLVDSVLAMAEDLPDDVVVIAPPEDAKWPRFALHRQAWQFDGERPQLSVGLLWTRDSVLLRGGSAPWVGVSAAAETEEGVTLRTHFRAAADPLRRERHDRTTPWWPAYRVVSADFDYWNDLDRCRDELVAALRDAWDVYAPKIDLAVAAWREAGA